MGIALELINCIMTLGHMTQSTNSHISPSLSTAHLSLRNEVINAGFDVEVLRDLLWLVNAHDQLIAFPFFCQNLIEILSVSTRKWQVPLSAFSLNNDIMKLLEWVVTEGTRLSIILGPQFGRIPKELKLSEKHPDYPAMKLGNPIVGRGVTRHPAYAALCNVHNTNLLKEKFRLLQGHVLYAHANELHSRKNRNAYENYGDQPHWNGLPNSPALACLAVRELSEHKFSDVLYSLSAELPPLLFAKSLENLPTVDDSDFLEHLKGLRRFLQKAAGIRIWVNRQGTGGDTGGGGGGSRIHGHVETTTQLYQDEIAVGDLDDPDSNWGDIVQITSTSPSPEEQLSLLSSDLYPHEFDTQDLLLTGDDKQTGLSGGISSNTGAQIRHVHMSNQLLPWNYQQLSISEVSEALSTCANWVNDHFPKNQPQQYDDADIKKLEAICLMRTILFTGSNIERARELQVLPHGKESEGGELAIIENANGLQEWRIRAIRPEYKTDQVATDGSDRKKTDYFSLPDTGITSRYLEILIDKTGSAKTKSENNYRVFRAREGTLRSNLKSLLAELDPNGRLTETKLSKFLFFRILEQSNGDICAASLITGDEHRLAHVRMFYSMIPVEHLQQVYLNATQVIVSQLFAATGKTNMADAPLPTYIKDKYVGSRLCPKFDTVRTGIASIQNEIQIRADIDDSVGAHNYYTLLTLWHFAFSTAYRAIETPYIPISEIDIPSGITLISDKDDGTKYKARLGWLPPHVLSRMQSYQEYQAELFSRNPDLKTAESPSIFFLDNGRNGNFKTTIVRPKSLEPLMAPFIPYPANFHRRFMRTELLARGCSIEVIDAYMGHWSIGEEPWSTYSSFTFQQYRDEMEKHLVPLMIDLGLKG